MNEELFWLCLTVVLTAVLWVPYIIHYIIEVGLIPALVNANAKANPDPGWARRLLNAHNNALENLAIFAPLVLALAVLKISTPVTVMAAMIYFFARLAHVILYTLGIPAGRTLAFATGFFCNMALAWVLYGALA